MKTHEAAFWTDSVGHAPLEPMNCVARYQDGTFDFFSGSQFQTRAMGDLSKLFGGKPEQIRVHQQYLGGAFGRRPSPYFLLAARLTSKALCHPSKPLHSPQ